MIHTTFYIVQSLTRIVKGVSENFKNLQLNGQNSAVRRCAAVQNRENPPIQARMSHRRKGWMHLRCTARECVRDNSGGHDAMQEHPQAADR